ncbi:TPA: hypothetical protein ACX6QU_003495 [Photobacterium damselae]
MAYIYMFIFLIGYEVWYIYNRDIAKFSEPDIISGILNQQFSFYFLSYIVFIPIFYICIFTFDNNVIFICIFILVMTHLTQEFNRIFIIRKDHVTSSTVQLIQASWLLLMPIGYISNINKLLDAMMVSLVFSFIFCLYSLKYKHRLCLSTIFRINFKLEYFKPYIYNLTLLVIVSMSGKILMYIPRIILENRNLVEQSGVLSYFQSIVTVVTFFFYYFVQSVYTSELLNLKDVKFNNSKKSFLKKTILLSVVMFILMSISGYVFFNYILHDAIYIDNYIIYIICLTSVIITNIGGYYSTLLYVTNNDREYRLSILYSMLLSFIPLIVLVCFIGPDYILLALTIGWFSQGFLYLVFNKRYVSAKIK